MLRSRFLSYFQEKSWARTLLMLGVIIILNTLLVLPLFRGGFTQFLSAIDGVFLADARFIAENWPYTSWNPLWYAGFPFDLFYTPLFPYLLAFFHKLSSNMLIISDLYRVFAGLFYVLSPVSLYLITKYLVKRESSALVAAVAYSILPFAYVLPDVYHDALPFNLAPWQLQVITRYADVPHLVSLSLIPLAMLFFVKTLQVPSFRRYVLTSFFITITALINWIGFFSLTLLIVVIFVSECFIGEVWLKIWRCMWCVALTAGFLAFWYTPEFIAASIAFGSRGVPPLMFIFVIVLAFTFMGLIVPVFYQRPRRQYIFIIGGWFSIFFTAIFFHYLLEIDLIPQPKRYILELSMATSMFIGIVVKRGIDRLKVLDNPFRTVFLWGYIVILTVLFCSSFLMTLGPSWNISQPHPSITDSSEYQIGYWLSNQVQGEERVYATGSHSFWLNAFSTVPQVSGGSIQASTNIWWEAVAFNLDNYHDGYGAILWARAFNVKYIVVNYHNSSVPYKNYKFPNKFEGLLEKVYEVNGDVVYEVPIVNPDIAQVVNIDEMNDLGSIKSVIDYSTLSEYVAVIDQNKTLTSIKTLIISPNQLILNASIDEGQAIHVQITYDAGWQAYSETSQNIPVESDSLGFILLYPLPGEQVIQMQHSDKASVYVGRSVTGLTILGVLIYFIWRYR